MPNGLVYDAGLTGCKTANRALASLVALNIWSALLAAFFGSCHAECQPTAIADAK